MEKLEEKWNNFNVQQIFENMNICMFAIAANVFWEQRDSVYIGFMCLREHRCCASQCSHQLTHTNKSNM